MPKKLKKGEVPDWALDPHMQADWSSMDLIRNFPGPYKDPWDDFQMPTWSPAQTAIQNAGQGGAAPTSPASMPSAADWASRALQMDNRKAMQLFGPDLFASPQAAASVPTPADTWKNLPTTIPSPSQVWRDQKLAGDELQPDFSLPQPPGYDPQKMQAKVNDAIMRLPHHAQPGYDMEADDRTTPALSPKTPSPSDQWRDRQLAGDQPDFSLPSFKATASGEIGTAPAASNVNWGAGLLPSGGPHPIVPPSSSPQLNPPPQASDSPYLKNQIESAVKQAGITSDEKRAQLRAYTQLQRADRTHRIETAKAIAIGKLDPATMKPEDVPWDVFSSAMPWLPLQGSPVAHASAEWTYNQLGDIAIRDPVAAHRLLVEMNKAQHTVEGARNVNAPGFGQGIASGLTKPMYQELPGGRTPGEAWGQHIGTAGQELIGLMAMGKTGVPAAAEAQAVQTAQNVAPLLGRFGPLAQKLAPSVGRGIGLMGPGAALRQGVNNTIQEKGPDAALAAALGETAMGPLFEGAGQFVGRPIAKAVAGAPGVRNLSPALRTLTGEAVAGPAVGATVGGTTEAVRLAGKAVQQGGLSEKDLKDSAVNFMMTTGELGVLHFVNALPGATRLAGFQEIGTGTEFYRKGAGDNTLRPGDQVRWQRVDPHAESQAEARGVVASEPKNGKITVQMENGKTVQVAENELGKVPEFIVGPLTPENAQARIAWIARNGDSMPDVARAMNNPDLMRVAGGASPGQLYENRNVRKGERPGVAAAKRANERIASDQPSGPIPEAAQLTPSERPRLDFGPGASRIQGEVTPGNFDFRSGGRVLEGPQVPFESVTGKPFKSRPKMPFQQGQPERQPIGGFGKGTGKARPVESGITPGNIDEFTVDYNGKSITFEGAQPANPSNTAIIDAFLRANDRANENGTPLPEKAVDGFLDWVKKSGYTEKGLGHEFGPGAQFVNGEHMKPQDIKGFVDPTQRPLPDFLQGEKRAASAPAGKPPIEQPAPEIAPETPQSAKPEHVSDEVWNGVQAWSQVRNDHRAHLDSRRGAPLRGKAKKQFHDKGMALQADLDVKAQALGFKDDATMSNEIDKFTRTPFRDVAQDPAKLADAVTRYHQKHATTPPKAEGRTIDDELQDRAARKSAAFEAINPEQDAAKISDLLLQYTIFKQDPAIRKAAMQQLEEYGQSMGYEGWPEAAQELFNSDDPILKHLTTENIQGYLHMNKETPPPDVMEHRQRQVGVNRDKGRNNVKGEEVANGGAAVPVDSVGAAGQGALETVPPEDVSRPPATGPAAENAVPSPGGDEGGVRADGPRGNGQSDGVGDGQGAVPVPAGREGRADAGDGAVTVRSGTDIKNILEDRGGNKWHIKDGVDTVHVPDGQFPQMAIDRLEEATIRGKFVKQETADGVTYVRPGAKAAQPTAQPAPASQQGPTAAPEQPAPAPAPAPQPPPAPAPAPRQRHEEYDRNDLVYWTNPKTGETVQVQVRNDSGEDEPQVSVRVEHPGRSVAEVRDVPKGELSRTRPASTEQPAPQGQPAPQTTDRSEGSVDGYTVGERVEVVYGRQTFQGEIIGWNVYDEAIVKLPDGDAPAFPTRMLKRPEQKAPEQKAPEQKAPEQKASDASGEQLTVPEVHDRLQKDSRFLSHAILHVYKGQTADEQQAGSTQHQNGIGFNGVDAPFMTSIAQQIEAGRPLSPKQIETARKIMVKYAKQISSMEAPPPQDDEVEPEQPTAPRESNIVKGREIAPPPVGSSGQTVVVEFHKDWGRSKAGARVAGTVTKVHKVKDKKRPVFYTNVDIEQEDGKVTTVPVSANFVRFFAGEGGPTPQTTAPEPAKPPQNAPQTPPQRQNMPILVISPFDLANTMVNGKVKDTVDLVIFTNDSQLDEATATAFNRATLIEGWKEYDLPNGVGGVISRTPLTAEHLQAIAGAIEAHGQMAAGRDDNGVLSLSDGSDDDWDSGPTIDTAGYLKGWKAMSRIRQATARIVDAEQAAEKETEAEKQRQEAAQRQKEADAKREKAKESWGGASNYTITGVEGIAQGGDQARFNANYAAIKLLKELEEEGRAPTTAEQAVLVKFTGWGGIPGAVDDRSRNATSNWYHQYKSLKELLTTDEWRAAQASTTNAHYTSVAVIRAIWGALKAAGFQGGRVLEPSMGVGLFYGAMPVDVRGNSQLMGVELDSITGRIAQMLMPKAHISIDGFQNVAFADNSLDLVISNVPFDNATKPVDANYNHLKPNLHNYFFLKALDKVRPGGVVVFITSAFTMDAQDRRVREALAGKADLVTAVRLPNTAFKDNARTSVVTDLIILRKRDEGEARAPVSWAAAGKYTRPMVEGRNRNGKKVMVEGPWKAQAPSVVGMNGEAVPVNEYFAAHPENIIGTIADDGSMHPRNPENSPPEMTVHFHGASIENHLSEVLARTLPTDLFQPSKDSQRASNDAQLDELFPAPGNYPAGSFYVEGTKLLQKSKDGMGVPIKSDEAARIKGMVAIRDAAMRTLRAYANGQSTPENIAAAQAALNGLYDAFQQQYGFLHDIANIKAFAEDPMGHLLLSLEDNYKPEKREKKRVVAPATADKAPIFSERIVKPFERPTTAANAQAALVFSLLETGMVYPPRMEELLGKPFADILQELNSGETPLVFNDPEKGYVTADEYLSGNVRHKLKVAQQALNGDKARPEGDQAFAVNVTALEAALPTPIPFAKIHLSMTSPWLEGETLSDFMRHLLDVSSYAISVTKHELAGTYTMVHGKTAVTSDNNMVTWATQRATAIELVKHLLRRKYMVIKDSVMGPEGRYIKVVNEAQTLLARQKADAIMEEFVRWINESPRWSAYYAEKYNDTINALKLRQFDGDHLTLPGASPLWAGRLRKHQKRAIWRALLTKRALFAHAVGAGKSLEMAGAIMEGKRMGLWHKPLMIVPNHMTGDAHQQFTALYPAARLHVGRKGMNENERKQFIAQIATGQWDAVLLPESMLAFIPMSKETTRAFYQEQLDQLGQAIQDARAAAGKDDATVKELAKAKARLETKMNRAMAKTRKDTNVDFETLGIDAMVVDEAHRFKNLFYATVRSRIKGLNNQAGSGKAFDLYMKFRWIQRNGGGTMMATGTPVANSMAEMYHMMRYLIPEQLEALGISSFDKWADAFGTIVRGVEKNVDGQYTVTDRFKQFINAPEMLKLFRDFADVITLKQLAEEFKANPNIDYPTLRNESDGSESRTHIVVPSSLEMKEFFLDIIDRAEAVHGGRVLPTEDNFLKITTDGRKAATDLRLVNKSVADDPNSKINIATKEIHSRWVKHADRKGTQIVFMDMGTPKRKVETDDATSPVPKLDIPEKAIKDIAKLILDAYDKFGIESVEGERMLASAARQLAAFGAFDTGNEPTALDVTFGIAGPIEDGGEKWGQKSVINQIKRVIGEGLGIEEMEDQDQLVLYEDLRQKLVAQGIPLEQVAFIHDFKTDAAKMQMFTKVKDGDIRVLIGSTEKMGVGMNVQDRVVAVHHMDAPWKPADIEQREGRGLRQGNKMGTIEVLVYTTEGSLDEMLWDTLKHKAEFIAQGMSDNFTDRVFAEVDDNVLGFQGISAATSGDPRRLRHFNLTNEVRNLENLRMGYDEQKTSLQQQRGLLVRNRKTVQDLTNEDDKLADIIKGTRDKSFTMTLGDQEHGPKERQVAAVALAQLIKAYSDEGKTSQDKVGHIGGLDVWLSAPLGGTRPHVYLVPPGAKITKGFIFQVSAFSTEASDSPQGTLATLENYLNEGFKDNAAEHATDLKDIDTRVAAIDKQLGKDGFPRGQELADKKRELIDLSRELKLPIDGFDMTDTGITNDYSDDDSDDDDDPDALIDAAEEQVLDEVLALKKGERAKIGSTDRLKRITQLKKAAAKEQRSLTPFATRFVADLLARHTDAAIRAGTPLKGAEGHFVEKAGGKAPRTPGTVVVKSRSEFNWRVTGHELGHALQTFIGWKPNQAEMEAVARKFYTNPKHIAKLSPDGRNKEGFAEFFRIWMVDPQNADLQKLAKNTLAEFEKHMEADPALIKAIHKARLAASADFQNSGLLRVSGASVLGTDAVPNVSLGNYELDGLKALRFQHVDFTIPFQDFDKQAGSYVAMLQVLHGHAMDQAHIAITAHARDRQGRFLTSGATLEQIAQKGIDAVAKKLNLGVVKNVKGPDGKTYNALHLFNYLITARMIRMRYESGHEGFEVGKGLPLSYKDTVDAEEWAEQHLGKDIINIAKQWSQALSDIRLAILKDAGVIDDEVIKRITEVSDPAAYMPSYYVDNTRGLGGVAARTFRGVGRYSSKAGALWDFMTAAKLSIAEAYQAAGFKEILDQIEEGLTHEGMQGFGTIIRDRGRTAVTISKQQLAFRAIQLLAGQLGIEKKDVKAAAQAAAQAAGKGWIKFWQNERGLAEFQGMPVVMNKHYKDGKLEEVPIMLAPEVFESIQAMRPLEVGALQRFMRSFGGAYRWLALVTPTTQGNIASRDLTAVVQQTKGTVPQIVTNLFNAVAVATGLPIPSHKQLRDLYSQVSGFGGVEGGRVKGIKTVSALPPGLRKVKGVLVWVVDRPSAMMHFFETYPRLAEFMTVVKKELSALGDKTPHKTLKLIAAGQVDQLPEQIQEAIRRIMVEGAYGSHEATANPGLHGANHTSWAVQSSVPFLQGSIQGSYRFARELADVAASTKEALRFSGGPDPIGRLKKLSRLGSFLARMFLTLVVPTLTSWYAMHRNQRDAAWLKDLPSEMRDRYHWFPNHITGGYIAVAKPYEYALLNNVLERYLDSLAGDKRTDVVSLLGTSFSFDAAHPWLKAYLGLKYNRNSFGGALVSDQEKQLPKQEQLDHKTSGTAIAISKLFFNVTDDLYAGPAPKQIDFALKEGGGGVGSLLLWLSDKAFGLDKGSDKGWDGAVKDVQNFVTRPFKGREWYEGGSRTVDRFYKDYARFQTYTGTIENWEKQKEMPYGTWTPEQLKGVKGLALFNSIADDLSGLRKAVAMQMKDASPEERKRLQSVYSYLQRSAAGLMYEEEPPLPKELTPQQAEDWKNALKGRAMKRLLGEVVREGGPTDAARWLQAAEKYKAGGQ